MFGKSFQSQHKLSNLLPKELRVKAKEADCDVVAADYPFVRRTPFANITKETLVLNGTELYSIYIDEPYNKTKTKYGW